MDRYPYFKYTILLGAMRALAHIGIHFTHRVFGLSASCGRGRRGRPRGTSQAPPVFDQQAFAEAVRIEAATIAQASAAGSQGGLSNLQRFRAHHPPIFTRGGDLMVADHWFMQV